MSEDAENTEEEKPKKGKKKLIMILVPLLLVGGGAGAYFGGFIGGGEKPDTEIAEEGDYHKEDGKEEKHAKKNEHGSKDDYGKDDGHSGGKSGDYVFMELPEIIVNLNTPNSRRGTFLKIKINLELNDEKAVETVETVMPRVIDSLQSYMRDLRVSDLQGSEGMYRLREELMHRINVAVGGKQVNDVLFAEMIMQ